MTNSDFWGSIQNEMISQGVSEITFEDSEALVRDMETNSTYNLGGVRLSEGKLTFVSIYGKEYETEPRIETKDAALIAREVFGDTFSMFSANEKIEIYDKFVDTLKNFYEKRNLVKWKEIEDTIHYKLNEMFAELESVSHTIEITLD